MRLFRTMHALPHPPASIYGFTSKLDKSEESLGRRWIHQQPNREPGNTAR